MITPPLREKIKHFKKYLIMQNCSSACGDITLLGNPKQDCSTSIRYTNLDRIWFYGCDIDLPNPITNIGMKDLYDNGLLVASSPLANITLGDPIIDEIQISDCAPTKKLIVGRQITAEDRVKIELTTHSPSSESPFFDHIFWEDKMEQEFQLRAMLSYCYGDVIIPVDKDGNPLTLSVLAFLNYQRPSTNSGKFVEFKSLSFDFNGDPLGLHIEPE